MSDDVIIARLVWSEDLDKYEIEWNHKNCRTKNIWKESDQTEAVRACDDGISDLMFFRMVLTGMDQITSDGNTIH
jgi:hypothetical protein